MIDDTLIKCRTEAQLRGKDSPFVFIGDSEYTLDKLNQMKRWNELCQNSRYRWIVDQNDVDQKQYMVDFFEM